MEQYLRTHISPDEMTTAEVMNTDMDDAIEQDRLRSAKKMIEDGLLDDAHIAAYSFVPKWKVEEMRETSQHSSLRARDALDKAFPAVIGRAEGCYFGDV